MMKFIYEFYFKMLGSDGFSILLLAITFSILIWPLQKYGKKFETKIANKMNAVQKDIVNIDPSLKGEARFIEIEKIYKTYDYHPIQSVLISTSFLIAIPVLLSAIILFTQTDILNNKSFYFISDLSKPDGLISLWGYSLNLLPILLFFMTWFDAQIRYKENPALRHRFLIISVVLIVLIYALPSGLILYWFGSNIASFFIAHFHE